MRCHWPGELNAELVKRNLPAAELLEAATVTAVGAQSGRDWRTLIVIMASLLAAIVVLLLVIFIFGDVGDFCRAVERFYRRMTVLSSLRCGRAAEARTAAGKGGAALDET